MMATADQSARQGPSEHGAQSDSQVMGPGSQA